MRSRLQEIGNGVREALYTVIVLAGIALCSTPSAVAHEFWITPTDFRPEPGATVGLKLYQGLGFKGQSLPYINEWFSSYVVLTPIGLRDIDGELGDDPAGTLRIDDAGLYLVVYQSTADFLSLDALRFNRFLREEGLEHIAQQRAERGESDQPGTEYYRRCAKTLLGTNLTQAAGFDRNFDCSFELILESNPHAADGAGVRLQARYLGKPIAGILVKGFTKAAPEERITARTDTEGRATLDVSRPGQWLLNAVHMIPANNRGDAQWESFWASLTFQIGGEL